MKKIILIPAILTLLFACKSGDSGQKAASAGMHAAIVQEVLQANQYTYLRVKENDQESWLAVPKMEASANETYYYKDGLVMTDFVSKDLNKTFSQIVFLDKISKSPEAQESVQAASSPAPAIVADAAAETPKMGSDHAAAQPASVRKVIAREVVQASNYTYLRAEENGSELWLAVSKMDASSGKTYFFKGGLVMRNFESKELKKTFDEILFVDNISTEVPSQDQAAGMTSQDGQVVSKGSAISLEKKAISLKHEKGEITIASLIENRKSYAGKTIQVRGQVTKFNSGIMKKNWIHLQDGTEFSGKFDLTITTDQDVKVGDTIVAEGVISLDKDFGFGYYYDVLMEDAKLKK